MINYLSIGIEVLVISLCITAAISVVQGFMNKKANKIFLVNIFALIIVGIQKEIASKSLFDNFSLIEFINNPNSIFIVLGWIFIIILIIGAFKGDKK